MGDDDELEALANRLGIPIAAVLSAREEKGWPSDIKKIIEEARRKHAPVWPSTLPPQSPPTPVPASRRIPAKVKPAVQPPNAPTAAKDPPAPVLMRATMRVHFSKFNKDFLPAEVIHEMMRNQVVPANAALIPEPMLVWCEKNCSDLWMPSPPAKPEYILFASSVDMDLFLVAFGGG